MQDVIISVLMPAYNAEKHIKEAIESVLNQTFSAFEFLIIDDGSTDRTSEFVESFTDPRIRLIRNETNRGLIYSLNLGLKEASGKYIARMDADDICLPERFERQVAFLTKNTDITVLGTAHRVLGTNIEVHHPKYDEEIKLQLFRKNAFTHPTVMFRKIDLEKQQFIYREKYMFTEDYGLWTEVASKGLKLANIEDVLLLYRQHDGQISQEKRSEQLVFSESVQRDYFNSMTSAVLTEEEIVRFSSIVDGYKLPFRENIRILDKLYRANSNFYKFHKPRFLTFISHLIAENLDGKKLKVSDFFFLFKYQISLRLIFKVFFVYISDNENSIPKY